MSEIPFPINVAFRVGSAGISDELERALANHMQRTIKRKRLKYDPMPPTKNTASWEAASKAACERRDTMRREVMILYKSGLSMKRIGAAMGTSEGMIKRIVKETSDPA